MQGRIFSGVQPTHASSRQLSGCGPNWVRMQKSYDCIFCVVDLHAITQFPGSQGTDPQHPGSHRRLHGLGHRHRAQHHLRPEPERVHAQLAWILGCTARIGWLNRMTQFKDKAGKDREAASVGLYTYPVLMAADILGYHATHVPVGGTRSSTWSWPATSPRSSTRISASRFSCRRNR